MLVITSKQDQTIKIGKDIEIVITAIHGKEVKIGINAPEGVEVKNCNQNQSRETAGGNDKGQ